MTRLRRLTATVAATALATGALLALSAGSAGAFPLTKVAPADNLTNNKTVKVITQTMTYKPGSGPITVTQCSSDLALAPNFGGPGAAPSANCHADTSIGALGVLTGNTAIQAFADSKGKLINPSTLQPYTMSVVQGQLNHAFTSTGGAVKLGQLQGYNGATHVDADCAPPLHRVLNSAIGGVNPLGAIPPADTNMSGTIEPSESGMRGPDGCVIAVTNIGGGFGPGGLPVQYEANPLRFKATTGGATAKLVLVGSSAAAPTDADMDTDLDLSTITAGSLNIQTPAASAEGEWSGFASNDNVNLQFLNKTDPQCNQNVANVITPNGQINVNVVLAGHRNPLPVGETQPVVSVDSDGFDTMVNKVLCHQFKHKVQIIGRGAPRPQGGAGVGSGGVSGSNKEVKMVSAALSLP